MDPINSMEEPNLLPRFSTRQDAFDYLDGHSVETADGLAERNLTVSLVKTLMLETAPTSGYSPPLNRVLSGSGLNLDWLDDEVGLLCSSSDRNQIVAIVEIMAERYPIVYSLLHSQHMTSLFNPLVRDNPWLDRLWISAPLFEELWIRTREYSHPERYTRIKFDYEPFFESADNDLDLIASFESYGDGLSNGRTDYRRASTFILVDRVSTIEQKLPGLQQSYGPLQSMIQLRIPSTSRGGHDFYFDGRVTNRSDSFYDHRSNVQDVVRSYKRATENSEEILWWVSESDSERRPNTAVLTISFSERLNQGTFDRWIESTFSRHGRFRLSGRVFRTGTGRATIAAIDRHLWQPFEMEVSLSGITAILPVGTCGNTVHRLVTNIQRYLDPAIEVWLGDISYRELVHSSFEVGL